MAHIACRNLDDCVSDASTTEGIDREGWVLTYADGTMVKVKTAEYFRLHRIIHALRPKYVHDMIVRGEDIGALIRTLPAEVADDIIEIETELRDRAYTILFCFRSSVDSVAKELREGTRKDAALWGKANINPEHLSLFFGWLDDRPVIPLVWRLVGDAL